MKKSVIQKFLTYGFFAFATLMMAGCHFVGDNSATPGAGGFLSGIWDGAVLPFSAILTCFTEIKIVDFLNDGFLYKVGFAVGMLGVSWNIGLVLSLISVFCYLTPF